MSGKNFMNKCSLKKILIIGPEVLPVPAIKGGAVESLINNLIDSNERNQFAKIHILSPFDIESYDKSLNYKNTFFTYLKSGLFTNLYKIIDRVCLKFFDFSFGIEYVHKVCSFIKKNSFDLILIENRPLFGEQIRKVYKGKLYLHLHNDTVHINSKGLNNILSSFDKMITISDYLKNRILDTGYKNVVTVYNGINLNAFNNKDISFLYPKRIIYSGRIVDDKGVLELIKAYNKLNYSNIQLILIGDFDRTAYKEKKYKKLVLNEIKKNSTIKYLGYLRNCELNDIYKYAYCGVAPSKFNECFSLSVVEMMASSLPIVCTDSGALPEVVSLKCGLFFDRNNLENKILYNLKKIIDDENLRNIMALNCRNNAQRFSIDFYLDNMINELYN